MLNTILAGTYTDSGSEGIYAFDLLEDGSLSEKRLFAKLNSPKYIDTCDGLTASIGKFEHGCGAAVIGRDGNVLSTLAFEDKTSCYITWHEGKIYTANYHLGTFSRLLFENGTLRMDKTVAIKEKAGCHQVLFFQDQILVPILFLDRIMIFNEDLDYQGSIQFPEGTGPRHALFTADGKTMYVLSELSNELFILDTDGWKLRGVMPVLPGGETHLRGSAAIRFGMDESRVYTSTRGQDIISVIDPDRQTVIQGAYSGGKHPRDFLITDGFLLSANRYSDTVIAYALSEDGTVGKETGRVIIPQAVSLAVLK